MATVYSLVCKNGSAGTYWSNLSSSGRLRYGSPGSERVYSGLISAIASLTSVSPLDAHYIEIADAFIESVSTQASFSTSLKAAQIIVATKVDGVRSAAFHFGDVANNSGGYIFTSSVYGSNILLTRPNVTIDGIKCVPRGSSFIGISASAALTTIKSCIVSTISTSYYGIGYSLGSAAVEIINSIFYGRNTPTKANKGFSLSQYAGSGGKIANCLAIGVNLSGSNGFFTNGTSSCEWSVVNCISMGFETNWNNTNYPDDSPLLSHNIGETGDTPWDNYSSSITGISSADFIDYDSDLRPADSTALQVGVGTVVPLLDALDLLDNPRPNYNQDGEENWDIGPFEFDHGNGLAPIQVSLSFSGIAEGSVLAVYKNSDNSEIISPTSISASGSHSTTLSYTGDVQIIVKVRKGTSGTKYLPYDAPGLITSSGFSLIVNQVEDKIAELI